MRYLNCYYTYITSFLLHMVTDDLLLQQKDLIAEMEHPVCVPSVCLTISQCLPQRLPNLNNPHLQIWRQLLIRMVSSIRGKSTRLLELWSCVWHDIYTLIMLFVVQYVT